MHCTDTDVLLYLDTNLNAGLFPLMEYEVGLMDFTSKLIDKYIYTTKV